MTDTEAAAALDRFGFVTNEVRADLETYVALLRQWQATHSLVGGSTLDTLWTRHIADSLQLLTHAPADFREWVDLGSGAGLPGLVVAIACKARPQTHFTLVESNGKKVAFLRAAIRATGARATVAAERIGEHAGKAAGTADVVSARALATLGELLALGAPYLRPDGVMLLLKGEDVVQELRQAAISWEFQADLSPSVTDPGGTVLTIRRPVRKGTQA